MLARYPDHKNDKIVSFTPQFQKKEPKQKTLDTYTNGNIREVSATLLQCGCRHSQLATTPNEAR